MFDSDKVSEPNSGNAGTYPRTNSHRRIQSLALTRFFKPNLAFKVTPELTQKQTIKEGHGVWP